MGDTENDSELIRTASGAAIFCDIEYIQAPTSLSSRIFYSIHSVPY